MAAAVIIKSDERRERQGQILRDFGHDPRTAGREAREQAELIAEKCHEAVEEGVRQGRSARQRNKGVSRR